VGVEVTALGTWANDLVAGGGFVRAGEVEANLIARWDGRAWHAFGEGLGSLGLYHFEGRPPTSHETHYPLAFAGGPGALYALGRFDRAGGLGVWGVARWNGERWENPAPDGGMRVNGEIRQLAVTGDGLCARGNFSVAGDAAVRGLALWHSDKWSDLSPEPPVGVRGGGLTRMAGDSSGLWVSAQAQGVAQDYPGLRGDLLCWNGIRWSRLTNCIPELSPAMTVRDGAVYYVGRGLRRWDGTNDVLVAPSPPFSYLPIQALGVMSEQRFCVLVGHGRGDRPGAFLYEGGEWKPLGRGEWGGAPFPATAMDGDVLYAAGGFRAAGRVDNGSLETGRWGGRQQLRCLARWHTKTGWEPVGLPAGGDFVEEWDSILALVCWRGQVYVGGQFSRIGRVRARNIARWDGQRWHALEGGVNGVVNALAVVGDYLYVGGSFREVSGKPASNFARWRLE